MARSSQAIVGTRIEWTTIPVWYLYSGGIVLAVILGLGGFFAYQAVFGPKHRAERAIARAKTLLDEAGKVAKPGDEDKILAQAEAKLSEASAAANQTSWEVATASAKASQALSEEILEPPEPKRIIVGTGPAQ